MKKYVLGLFAIALAIGFSAFTSSKKVAHVNLNEAYYVYDVQQQGPQDDPNSYTIQQTPPEIDCENAATLCWFKVGEEETFKQVFDRLDVIDDDQIKANDLPFGEDHTTVELRQ